MPRLFCQEFPETLVVCTTVLDRDATGIQVACSPFFPGGGGQLADRGWVRGADLPTQGLAVTGILPDPVGAQAWLHLAALPDAAGPAVAWPEPGTPVELTVDAPFRHMQAELHTLAHLVNSLVFTTCNGALLTGAQLGDDATLRMDFDLPEVDNGVLRALADPLRMEIQRDREIRTRFLPRHEAQSIPGLFRSKAVAPPEQADGQVRVVEIVGLDQQACGGTHLPSTGRIRSPRIVKIENKGRHNRRIRLAVG